MAKNIRVSDLAKELGVKSKDILERCQQEGVADPPKTASSGVKMGLAYTIRGWFEGGAAPVEAAVEPAPEAAEKAEAPVKKTAAKKATAKKATAKKATAKKATAKKATVKKAPVAKAPVKKAPVKKVATLADAKAAADAARTEAEGDNGAPSEDKKRQVVMPAGRQNVPDRPDVVTPAGEQLAEPKKKTLRGPRVVRIEAAEDVPVPGRGGPGRGGPRGRRDEGGHALPTGEATGFTRTKGPTRGGGVKGWSPEDGGGGGGGPQRGGQGKGKGKGGGRRSLSRASWPWRSDPDRANTVQQG